MCTQPLTTADQNLFELPDAAFVAEMLRRFEADGAPEDEPALARLERRLTRAGLLTDQ